MSRTSTHFGWTHAFARRGGDRAASGRWPSGPWFTRDSISSPTRPAKCLGWRELRRNTLLRLAKIRFGSGVIIADIAINQSGSRTWASPPSRPWAESGKLVVDPTTRKPKYSPIITFETHGVQSAWSRQVLRAIRSEYPEAPATEDDSDSLEGAEALQWHRRQGSAAA
jgi:hypothetical protein